MSGDRFAEAATRLAGQAGALFGWTPDIFWRATPAELGAIVAALRGADTATPPEADIINRLKKAFPDG